MAAAAAGGGATSTYLEIPCKVRTKGSKTAPLQVQVGCPWADTIDSFKQRLLDTLGVTYVSDPTTVKMLHQGLLLDNNSTLEQPKDQAGNPLGAILMDTEVTCVVPADPGPQAAQETDAGTASASASASAGSAKQAAAAAAAAAAPEEEAAKNCGICQDILTDRTRAEILCGHLCAQTVLPPLLC